MAQIYIAFVDTPGIFAAIIRHVLKQKYIHVAVSLDPSLEETYSIGRRHPAVPLIAGFTREEKNKVIKAFPNADYLVCRMDCSTEQKETLEEILRNTMSQRFHYHYAILGLPFILWNRPFYQKNHYTCSSYLAKILEEAGICKWEKHFSLVTPKDFYEYPKKLKIFEGSLAEFIARNPSEEPERLSAWNLPGRFTAAWSRAL